MVIFEAVVREGGFSAAARALGVSKAHVSKQVAQLEDSVGVRLLQRTTRVVRPTDAGQLFYERCAEMTRMVEEAGGLLSSIQEDVMGRLRVSIPASFGRTFLEKPVAAFIARFPRLEVEIDVTDQMVNVLREGYDLSIRVGPVTDPDLVTRKLCGSRRLVVASPSLLAKVGGINEPRDLIEQPCLLYAHQVPKDRWIFRGARGSFEIPVSGRVRSGSGEFLATAAAEGLGFAWLPDFVVRERLESGELVSILEAHCEHEAQVQAVLPARKFIPIKVQEFLSHLQRVLTEGLEVPQ